MDANVQYGSYVYVTHGQKIDQSGLLLKWDPYSSAILADFEGKIEYSDIIEDTTVRTEIDETTGAKQIIVIDSKDKNLSPKLIIKNPKTDEVRKEYLIPSGANIVVQEGQEVLPADQLAKIARGGGAKSTDITGGLPRVAELFEARKPKNATVVSEIDGTASFGGIKRGVREIFIENEYEKRTYKAPHGKHILVQEGDYVIAGESLTEGSASPHDILEIQGPGAVQEYLVNEIQEVYRLQGVKINDKHIEIIVRQMLQKVQVVDQGDTTLLEGQLVDRTVFEEANTFIEGKFAIDEAGDTTLRIGQIVTKEELDAANADVENKAVFHEAETATKKNILLGITQASLTTESFISAASFQETTKVLTEAAIQAKVDGLKGLKENVIMGNLIPAGTGLEKFRDLYVSYKDETEAEVEEILLK